MIKKILKLKNVGLFRDALPSGAVTLEKVTAFYADNGRGKSTFSTVLRACHSADVGRINTRKTIDVADLPDIEFLFQTGQKVEFKSNVWTGVKPDVAVFDSEFVEQNVYSGLEVRADQRESLLEFALGSQTVELKKKINQLTEDISVQTRKRSQAEKALDGYMSPYMLPAFLGLLPVPDASEKIEALKKQVEAAKNAQSLLARQNPSKIPVVGLDIQNVFSLLQRHLENIHQTADGVVRSHVENFGSAGIETWISQGQAHLKNENCPFCGRSMSGLELLAAYRSHFNQAYANFTREIALLEAQISSVLADSKMDAIIAATEVNTARIDAWKDQVDLVAPVFDGVSLRVLLAKLREDLLALVKAKQQAILDPVGTTQQCADSLKIQGDINGVIATYNTNVMVCDARISAFKVKLGRDAMSGSALQAEIKKLEAAIKRQQPEVVQLVAEYRAADLNRGTLDGEKTTARAQLDLLMQDTLTQYQASINQLLGQLGADFSIEKMKPNYAGGTPRGEYGLLIRDRQVKLGSRADSGHSFSTTLSEADKRTLAFSFFVARVRAADANIAGKIIVLDDPISSLDRNRRQQSTNLIFDLSGECCQLIVLSHDAYFIREFRDKFVAASIPKILEIKRVQHKYSAIAPCDIEDICSSDYYRHHRMIADYVAGSSTTNIRDVAKAIRPLLEGYYHRRFPGKISKKATFGKVITDAVASVSPDPLANLKPLERELHQVNDYAGKFHHDTNPGNADTAPVVDGELLPVAQRALDLIYKNG